MATTPFNIFEKQSANASLDIAYLDTVLDDIKKGATIYKRTIDDLVCKIQNTDIPCEILENQLQKMIAVIRDDNRYSNDATIRTFVTDLQSAHSELVKSRRELEETEQFVGFLSKDDYFGSANFAKKVQELNESTQSTHKGGKGVKRSLSKRKLKGGEYTCVMPSSIPFTNINLDKMHQVQAWSDGVNQEAAFKHLLFAVVNKCESTMLYNYETDMKMLSSLIQGLVDILVENNCTGPFNPQVQKGGNASSATGAVRTKSEVWEILKEKVVGYKDLSFDQRMRFVESIALELLGMCANKMLIKMGFVDFDITRIRSADELIEQLKQLVKTKITLRIQELITLKIESNSGTKAYEQMKKTLTLSKKTVKVTRHILQIPNALVKMNAFTSSVGINTGALNMELQRLQTRAAPIIAICDRSEATISDIEDKVNTIKKLPANALLKPDISFQDLHAKLNEIPPALDNWLTEFHTLFVNAGLEGTQAPRLNVKVTELMEIMNHTKLHNAGKYLRIGSTFLTHVLRNLPDVKTIFAFVSGFLPVLDGVLSLFGLGAILRVPTYINMTIFTLYMLGMGTLTACKKASGIFGKLKGKVVAVSVDNTVQQVMNNAAADTQSAKKLNEYLFGDKDFKNKAENFNNEFRDTMNNRDVDVILSSDEQVVQEQPPKQSNGSMINIESICKLKPQDIVLFEPEFMKARVSSVLEHIKEKHFSDISGNASLAAYDKIREQAAKMLGSVANVYPKKTDRPSVDTTFFVVQQKSQSLNSRDGKGDAIKVTATSPEKGISHCQRCLEMSTSFNPDEDFIRDLADVGESFQFKEDEFRITVAEHSSLSPRQVRIGFSAIPEISGGKKPKRLSSKQKKEIFDFLASKRTTELYKYAKLKGYSVTSKFTKQMLADTIVKSHFKQKQT